MNGKSREQKVIFQTGISYPTQDIAEILTWCVLQEVSRGKQQKIGEKLRNFSYLGGTKSGRHQNQSLYELQGYMISLNALEHFYYL